MVVGKVLFAILLSGVCQGFLPRQFRERVDRPNWYKYWSGIGKRGMDSPGDPETPTTDQESVEHLGVPQDIPWDMMIVNPMLRGKKSIAADSKGFPCMMKSKMFYHCNLRNILMDGKTDIQQLLSRAAVQRNAMVWKL
eukprot:GFUD01125938.1.p1 GENE.GFUD01125938.1~~GFUD01125938.1.p1  ORF type:complete len:138 (-),score=24.07 GFUD01125938.1:60-473(-)